METKQIKINEVKNNPNNPRIVKDEKFQKLVESIKNFPEMLLARPVIINQDFIILGGNQRLKAAKQAGLTHIPVKIVDWPEEKQREFIIKDNSSVGDWDWNMIIKDWDNDELNDWGLQTPDFGHDVNNMTEQDLDFDEKIDPYGVSSNYQKLTITFSSKEDGEKWLNDNLPELVVKKIGASWNVDLTTQSI